MPYRSYQPTPARKPPLKPRERMTVELYDELKHAFRSKWPRKRRYYPSASWDPGMSQDEFDPDIGDR